MHGHEHELTAAHETAAPASTPARTREGALRAAASAAGNATFARFARSGSGLLPGGGVHAEVQSGIDQARGSGSALDGAARERLAAALGDGLADVRVHADERADQLARAVAARAFTTGNDVFFARGEYRPGTPAGDRLLAHELTHVVQQRGAPVSGPLTVTDPAGALEAEAEAVADAVAAG